MEASEIGTNRLYNDLAWLWPIISDPADYADEAAYWRAALRDNLGPGRHEILELGVGGGHNLSHLSREFKATAVDLSEAMLAHSRRLNPDAEHIVGDMRTIRLGKTFKAVLIHDAISYLLTENDIRATLQTAAVHLETGGVFVTAPDHTWETFKGTQVRSSTTRSGELEITHIEFEYDPDPADTTYDTLMTYLIRRGDRLQVELDRHRFGLFPLTRWLSLLEEAGFETNPRRYDVHDDNRQTYLLIGIKR